MWRRFPLSLESCHFHPLYSVLNCLLEHVTNSKAAEVRKPFGEHIAKLAFMGSSFKLGEISSLTLRIKTNLSWVVYWNGYPKERKPIRCSVLLWSSLMWVFLTPLHVPKQKKNTGAEPCLAMTGVRGCCCFFLGKVKLLKTFFTRDKKKTHRLKNLIRWSLYLETTCFPVNTELPQKKLRMDPHNYFLARNQSHLETSAAERRVTAEN